MVYSRGTHLVQVEANFAHHISYFINLLFLFPFTVEEFEDEGDYGYSTEATEDFDLDALHESTPSTNFYDFLLEVCMNKHYTNIVHEQILYKY